MAATTFIATYKLILVASDVDLGFSLYNLCVVPMETVTVTSRYDTNKFWDSFELSLGARSNNIPQLHAHGGKRDRPCVCNSAPQSNKTRHYSELFVNYGLAGHRQPYIIYHKIYEARLYSSLYCLIVFTANS